MTTITEYINQNYSWLERFQTVELDFSKLTEIAKEELSEIILNCCPIWENLKYVKFGEQQLEEDLIIGGCPNLVGISCANNSLTCLDLSPLKSSYLEWVDSSKNELIEIF